MPKVEYAARGIFSQKPETLSVMLPTLKF